MAFTHTYRQTESDPLAVYSSVFYRQHHLLFPVFLSSCEYHQSNLVSRPPPPYRLVANLEERPLNAPKRPQEYHYVVDPRDLVLISDPTHPLYDERIHRKPPGDMIQNIMYRGVIKPIIVTIEDGRMLVVDGRQRVKAARIASDRLEEQGMVRLRIKCIHRRGDAHDMLVTMISANEHRYDDDPMIRAKKAARLMALRASEAEVANCFGVTVQSIRNWLTLLDLAPSVQQAVSAGRIGATAATKLAHLPYAQQEAQLEELIRSNQRVTVNRVDHSAKTATGKRRGPLVPKRQLQRLYRHRQLSTVLGEEARGVLALLLGEHDDILSDNPALAHLLEDVRLGKRQRRRFASAARERAPDRHHQPSEPEPETETEADDGSRRPSDELPEEITSQG